MELRSVSRAAHLAIARRGCTNRARLRAPVARAGFFAYGSMAIACGLSFTGCGREQSMLHATGVEADKVASLTWIMFAGGLAVLLLVLGLLLYALFRHPARRAAIHGGIFIVAGGVVLPVVTLTALLVYTLSASRDLRTLDSAAPIDVEIIGRQWWWEVRYRGDHPAESFSSANELHMPLDKRMRIKVSSADVIHSFWAPTLAGKIDLIPGVDNEIVIHPTRAGITRGQCAEFCGVQHALMAFYVVVHEQADFESWRRQQRRTAAEPEAALERRGKEIFLSTACAYCHTVRGTPAGGRLGPDLTHVGSRLSLAAGTLPANRGNLMAWIVDAQHLKPGSQMPSFREFTGEELQALAAYLESLR